jgi:putative transposase
MARENPTWGEERIANELFLKLGLRVSPRTVRKYMLKRLDHGRGTRVTSQHWRTFVRNHAQAIIACDFCVVVTATFRLLYISAYGLACIFTSLCPLPVAARTN